MEEQVNEQNMPSAEAAPSNAAPDIKTINDMIQKESAFVDLLMMEMNKVIIGQKHRLLD